MDDRKPPKIEGAPGLVWRPRQGEWSAYWQARTDIFKRGWKPGVVPLWRGIEPGERDILKIQDECNELQNQMLLWSRGGLPDQLSEFTGTVQSLCDQYQKNKYSKFPKLQYATRGHYLVLMKALCKVHGDATLSSIRGPILIEWHEQWEQQRGIPMAKQLVRMLRILISFGISVLENAECIRLDTVMGKMRFRMPQKRSSWLRSDQATAIRTHAHTTKYKSIALAQAFQFDCLLRQKDVIGEWLPQSEPGMSDVAFGKRKWVKGIRWEAIDDKLVIRHITSKRQKPLEVPLRLCPMVMEEFGKIAGPDLIVIDAVTLAVTINRHLLPATGPVICMDTTGRPWHAMEYRVRWRQIATAVGVPKAVFNMDSRAGGITEASDAGAPLEHIRHAATHSDIQTTQGYSRGAADKTAEVLKLRVAFRENAKKT